jgi:biofilm protein TabA
VILYYPPTTQSVTLHMRPGHFAVFLPQDAHRPGVMADQPSQIKKLVFKVATSLLSGDGCENQPSN